jgi:hypothetical protein
MATKPSTRKPIPFPTRKPERKAARSPRRMAIEAASWKEALQVEDDLIFSIISKWYGRWQSEVDAAQKRLVQEERRYQAYQTARRNGDWYEAFHAYQSEAWEA